jgi:hypothetical protein
MVLTVYSTINRITPHIIILCIIILSLLNFKSKTDILCIFVINVFYEHKHKTKTNQKKKNVFTV